jgi:dihydrofolate reductase
LAGEVAKTQYYTATSIDGFIADPGNSLDWLFQVGQATDVESSMSTEDRFGSFFSGVGAMAMGAATYEWALEHGHLRESGKWQEYYGPTPCWVFTHRQLPLVPGANLAFAQGDVGDVHEQMMTAANGKNVWLVGGGDLAGQFADRGLLDEILLGVAPVMLGGGTPLLPRRLLASELTLASVEHDSRFVFLTYTLTSRGRQARLSAATSTRHP